LYVLPRFGVGSIRTTLLRHALRRPEEVVRGEAHGGDGHGLSTIDAHTHSMTLYYHHRYCMLVTSSRPEEVVRGEAHGGDAREHRERALPRRRARVNTHSRYRMHRSQLADGSPVARAVPPLVPVRRGGADRARFDIHSCDLNHEPNRSGRVALAEGGARTLRTYR
jgi:hypothetical protein